MDYYATAPAAPPQSYPSTGWSPAPPPPPKRRPGFALGWVKIVLTLLVALWGARWALVTTGFLVQDPLHTPLQVGTAPRIETTDARRMEQEITKSLKSFQDPQVGVYGSGDLEYVLLAAFGTEKSGREVLRGFVDEGRRSGATFGKLVAMPGELTCTTVSDAGDTGAICAWAGKRSNGVLWALANDDVKELASLAATARTQVDA